MMIISASLSHTVLFFLCYIAITVPHFYRYFVNPAITFIPFTDYYFFLQRENQFRYITCFLLKHFILIVIIVIIPFPEKKIAKKSKMNVRRSEHQIKPPYAWVNVSCLWKFILLFFLLSFKCKIMCLHGDFLLFNHIFDYACTFTACQRYWYTWKIP